VLTSGRMAKRGQGFPGTLLTIRMGQPSMYHTIWRVLNAIPYLWNASEGSQGARTVQESEGECVRECGREREREKRGEGRGESIPSHPHFCDNRGGLREETTASQNAAHRDAYKHRKSVTAPQRSPSPVPGFHVRSAYTLSDSWMIWEDVLP